jgi:hypothetical protein
MELQRILSATTMIKHREETMKRHILLVTASIGLYLLLPNHGLAQNNQGQNDQGIKLGILNGTYSVHITGYVPDSSGNEVPLAVAGRVTHFANGSNGTESGVATASVNGQLQTTTFTGTLTVNPDGVSWSETVTQTSPPSLTLHYILYLRRTAISSMKLRPIRERLPPGF